VVKVTVPPTIPFEKSRGCMSLRAAQIRVVFLLILLASTGASAAPRYFPPGALGDDAEFIEHWYAEQLTALKEQPLCCGAKDSQTTVRFAWLRSFHHPVAIRLFQSGDGRWLLTTKVASGAGGYKPGHLTTNATRELKASDAEQILSLVAPGTDYWKLSSRGEEKPSADGLIRVQVDGAQWIIEVLDGNAYHVVDRWSPESGIIHDLGMRFMALSGRKFGSVY
jgi:hypothetical protein